MESLKIHIKSYVQIICPILAKIINKLEYIFSVEKHTAIKNGMPKIYVIIRLMYMKLDKNERIRLNKQRLER